MAATHSPQTSFYRHFSYRTPHGVLTIEQCGDALTGMRFGVSSMRGPKQSTALMNLAATQVMEYFAGKRQTFDLPLALEGTDFQKRVWNALRAIPYGQGRCTTDIARDLGEETAYRSVGSAIKKCPFVIVVPVHRIVAAPGRKLNATKENVFNAALLKAEQDHLG